MNTDTLSHRHFTLIAGVSNIRYFFAHIHNIDYNISKSSCHDFLKELVNKELGKLRFETAEFNPTKSRNVSFITGKVNITVAGLRLYGVVADILPTICQFIPLFFCATN